MEKVLFRDLGEISYKKAWDLQGEIMKSLVKHKRSEENAQLQPSQMKQNHQFLFCEHRPVYTLGKSGSLDNLLLSEAELAEKNIDFYKINRGGDITYHGPGQVVGYPIFDLDCFFNDIHQYVRYLEEAVIRTMAEYGLLGERIKGYTGVWILEEGKPKRKICAIGVHMSRWVSMHGFAFNINTDLKYFRYIIPCGIEDKDKTVTSMEYELGRKLVLDEIKAKIKFHFAEIFQFEIIEN